MQRVVHAIHHRCNAAVTTWLLVHGEQVCLSQEEKMALPLNPGLTPAEVAFMCEMELVTVIPRQRLEALELLGVSRLRVQDKYVGYL